MKPLEVIERLQVCIATGAIESAVALLHEHGDDPGLADEVRSTEDCEVVAWVFYGAHSSSAVAMAPWSPLQKMSVLPPLVANKLSTAKWKLNHDS